MTDESCPLHLFVGLKNELKMFVDVEKIDQARMLLNLVGRAGIEPAANGLKVVFAV
ncbi:MAG: hypothetical protein ABSC54_00625 [Smithellaceae bacterium]